MSIYTPPVGNAVNFDLQIFTPLVGNSLVFDLSELVPPSPKSQYIPAFMIWKKFNPPSQNDFFNMRGVWQRRHTKRGIVSVKMKLYSPTNPRTTLQQANRQRFADAMAAWKNLTNEQKAVYNKRAKRQQLFGWNVFIKEYFAAHPL